jgi:predicted transcriptional regulator
MKLEQLLKDAVVDRIKVYQAAGTSDVITSDAVDMSCFEGALFLCVLGTLTSTGTVTCKLQQSSDDAASDAYSDIEGTSVVNTGDTATTKILAIDIKNPGKRYLKLLATRATANCAIDAMIVIKYGPKLAPVTQSADVDASEAHVCPAEGTA